MLMPERPEEMDRLIVELARESGGTAEPAAGAAGRNGNEH